MQGVVVATNDVLYIVRAGGDGVRHRTLPSAVDLQVKLSVQQWNEIISHIPLTKRAPWMTQVVRDFMAEHPVLTAIPLHETETELIFHRPVHIQSDPEMQAWFKQIPAQMRSYMARWMVKWYQKKHNGQIYPQPPSVQMTIGDQLQPTGTTR